MASSEKFWTVERIKATKPKEFKRSRRRTAIREREVVPPKEDDNNTKATFVDVSDMLKHPFKSVGFLFFMQGGVAYNASAYVADLDGKKDIIFTAGHNLWDEDGVSQHISFTPGMIRIGDAPPHGIFNAIPGKAKWSSKWNPFDQDWEAMSQFDFGIVQLEPVNQKAVGQIVTPISILWDADNESSVKWTTLAYPSRKKKPNEEDNNPTRRMMQQVGEHVRTRNQVVKKKCCECPLGHGASGGVWLRKLVSGDIVANGVHIVSDESDYTSWSPYFTRSIVPELY